MRKPSMQRSNNPQSPDTEIILKILATMLAQMQPADRAAVRQLLDSEAKELLERSSSPADGRRLGELARQIGL